MAPEPSERSVSERPTSERERRAERILDAAGELLVAWGYGRVTVDDVARRAGVGKGTIYLHFSTKEGLFLSVLMRAQSRLMANLVDLLRREPVTVMPSELIAHIYRWAHEEPVVRAALIGDPETLGVLVRSSAELVGDLLAERLRVMESYLVLLREHGLVRTDQPPELVRYTMVSIFVGFLTMEPMMPAEARPDPAACAGALADAIRSSIETARSPEAMRAAADLAAELFDRLLDRLNQEIRRRQSI
ncbi:TetR/AcrR family transcriptional regulator [Spongiactinospora gelatinilytica]|uniref:TetR/AcrR family transcriptional regulator n=1 Tax=Spongiactinospora gelatinilytica TaxID=2666298 RepID=UPI001F400A73|nr:TetR/AcrR family transcriptional regulator [Spongiactinospora gelatinilytica]